MASATTESTRTLTLVLAGGQGSRLYPLTVDRSKPAVPFGGTFRIIDFTLSNCLNSGLRRLCVLTQYKHEELHRYVREDWRVLWNDFRRDRGEFLICIPPASGKTYRGTADAVLQNIAMIKRQRPEFVLILSGDHIYHMDYGELVQSHADSSAGLTVAAVNQPIEEASRFGVLEVDARNRVTGFEEKPVRPKDVPGNSNNALVSMGVYVFNTAVLLRALEQGAAMLDRSFDFGKHVIPTLIHSVSVHAHAFRNYVSGAPRYWRDIGTIDSYYEASMELTQDNPPFDPYTNEDWPTRTVGASGPPPCRPFSRVRGCVLNSVVSSGVHVAAGAAVEDSILLHGATIGSGARLRRTIVEEGVEIPGGVEIGYNDSDYGRYFVTQSGIVVVTRHSVEMRPVEAGCLRACAGA